MTIFNDGNRWHYVVDPDEYVRHRDVYEMRTCSADPDSGYEMYVDPQFANQRAELQPRLKAYLHYQFPYQRAGSPEAQAEFFIDALGGSLRDNEMVMLDTESASGLIDPVGFTRQWCSVVENELKTRAWIYVPSALAGQLTRDVTGTRIVKAPRYSGGRDRGSAPWWPFDVHQFTDRGYFPGCHDVGDVNYTTLSPAQMLLRCSSSGRDLPPSSAIPPSARPVLEYGDTGPWVRTAQELLSRAGV